MRLRLTWDRWDRAAKEAKEDADALSCVIGIFNDSGWGGRTYYLLTLGYEVKVSEVARQGTEALLVFLVQFDGLVHALR